MHVWGCGESGISRAMWIALGYPTLLLAAACCEFEFLVPRTARTVALQNALIAAALFQGVVAAPFAVVGFVRREWFLDPTSLYELAERVQLAGALAGPDRRRAREAAA